MCRSECIARGPGGWAEGVSCLARLPSCPASTAPVGRFAATWGAPGCRYLAPRQGQEPRGSQDPGWSAIFPRSELPAVWGFGGLRGRREEGVFSTFPQARPRSAGVGPAVLRFRERPVQGMDMQSRRHGEAGLLLRGREPAPTACTGTEDEDGPVFLPAPQAGLRRSGLWGLPRP